MMDKMVSLLLLLINFIYIGPLTNSISSASIALSMAPSLDIAARRAPAPR
jgi:hypothetical protein